ncbi:AAC(3) family N-acetyltransferase [Streptomyces sp. DSM 44917]|uniref:AAC(3) family N-acetyltransferase n=1 Tax=Streptomyces boetiae TaxID=3075541 RepID=A0ABU2LDI3_9ACTN|nr:AAC(3) family N-acetyltransferase [Streptomyces sp. DSM 44917]MDT0309352.1 AAC(3) family N-acetyltransferase [Streptomyces sp. DSM 44917]
MMTGTAVTGRELAEAVDRLGLTGRPVMLHGSLRSFGRPLAGGPDGLLDALLWRGCTVLVPAFSEPYFDVPPPPGMRPERNGVDYAAFGRRPPLPDGPVYSPTCGLICARMGALPAALIARGGARRGLHPLNSFAALGPLAAELAGAQTPADLYAPVRLLAEHGGSVLLAGVGLDRMTALHLAEQRAGRRLFVRWARTGDGRVAMVEVGSCSEGFPRLGPRLAHLAASTTVAASRWTAYPAREMLDAAAALIAADPTLTRCGHPRCRACPDAVAGGPLGPAPLEWRGA